MGVRIEHLFLFFILAGVDCLAHSRLTAIPHFANVALPQTQKRSSLRSLALEPSVKEQSVREERADSLIVKFY